MEPSHNGASSPAYNSPDPQHGWEFLGHCDDGYEWARRGRTRSRRTGPVRPTHKPRGFRWVGVTWFLAAAISLTAGGWWVAVTVGGFGGVPPEPPVYVAPAPPPAPLPPRSASADLLEGWLNSSTQYRLRDAELAAARQAIRFDRYQKD